MNFKIFKNFNEMSIFILCFVINIFFVSPSFSFSNEYPVDVCILIFQKKDHFLTKYINKIFLKAKYTKIIVEAKPVEILNCVKEKVSEILMVVHSTEDEANSNLADLLFYLPMSDKDRSQLIGSSEQKVIHKLAELGREPRNGYVDINQFDFKTEENEEWTKQVNHLMNEYEGIIKIKSNNMSLYKVGYFDPYIFHLIYDELLKQKQFDEVHLKKIRLATCMVDKVLARYPEFVKLTDDFYIILDLPNKTKMDAYSEIRTGKKGVSFMLKKDWYAQSFRAQTSLDKRVYKE